MDQAIVIKMLSDLKSPTEEMVRAICDQFLIGVVVTREEDAVLNKDHRCTMPREFFEPDSPAYHDPWLRYKKCNIELLPSDHVW
jgi:hypothetical protein